MYWFDLKGSPVVLLASACFVLGDYFFVFFVTKLPLQEKAWRFTYIGQELLIPVFLFWLVPSLQRWFGREESETLRVVEQKHNSLYVVLLSLLFEFLLYIPLLIIGWKYLELFLLEIIRLILLQAIMMSIMYFLTVMLKHVLPALVITVGYCFFCTLYSLDRSLAKFCIVKPGSPPADWNAIWSLWFFVLLSALLCVVARHKEKKMIWMN